MDLQTPSGTAPPQAEAAERPTAIFFAGAEGAADAPQSTRSSAGPVQSIPPKRRLQIPKAAMLGVIVFGLLLYGSIERISGSRDGARQSGSSNSVSLKVPPIDLPPPNLLKPISPDEAIKENAERPFVRRPDTPAGRFVLHAADDSRERALTCLAQAVYYEAAGEGADGERAVAQVVINRMRHPGYPASVCGVVYQGSDKGSGCQFTFTCDGSLLRTPVPSMWARARKIAQEALSGHVFAPIGHATHYHADYVLPYWADSLDKTVQIGRHIFYRLPSVLGDSRSFFQHYAGSEPQIPQPGAIAQLDASASTEALATALIGDGSHGTAQAVEKAAEPSSPLAIDSSHSTLIADTEQPATQAHRAKPASECTAPADRKQLAPLSANDVRAGVTPSGC